MMTFLRRHRFWILALALLAPGLWFASAHGVHAQVTANEVLPSDVGNAIGLGTTDIRVTIARIIRVALGLLGTVALLIVLYAGFLWLTAGGEAEKVDRAKKTLTGGVIGLVIILMSFAIVSFVLSGLTNAINGDQTGGGGGGGGGGGFGGGGSGFRVTGIQPQGTLAKYDVLAAVTLSDTPTSDTANIKANIKYEKIVGSTRTAVAFDPIVDNNTIRLQPTQTCPAPNATKRCLEPNQNYEITVSSGLKAAASSVTVSCGIGNGCKGAFKTGDAVATGLPTVTIQSPSDGESRPANDLVALQSIATDQNGIANIDYSADGAFFKSDVPHQVAASTYSSQSVWDTTGITPVRTVTLTAKATNIDGDAASSAPVRVVVRPGFCFNGVKDGDEAAIDCGGSCGACTGATCTNNVDCTSGQCVNGVCVESPKITGVDAGNDPVTPSGKPGNLVTITGEHFGSQAGKVAFLGAVAADDDKEAALANCSGAWTDRRIVVVVPAGAVKGPIQVTVFGGAKKDATNDAFGPKVNDFVVNDVAAPGICAVSPASVKIGQNMTVTGVAFGAARGPNDKVQLARADSGCNLVQTDWSTAANASQISPWTDTSLVPTMPNIETGLDGANYLLRVTAGGQPSNTACVRAEPPSAGTDPHIDFLSPVSGSVGTYMTVFGSNFGGGGTVHFKNSAGDAVGDTSFPAQCSTGFWTESSVTVKVPPKFATGNVIELGSYAVTVVRSDGRASNPQSFTIDTSPLGPGVCKIDPNNGPAGIGVTLYGEGFGDIPQANLPADAVSFQVKKNASVGLWQAASIKAVVPAGAVTGAVVAKKVAGASTTLSNGINFQVSDCRQTGGDVSCGSGKSCCEDGSCRASCAVTAASGGYAWQFATGPIPVYPVVIENATCQLTAPTMMPSPNPYKGATDVCTDIGAMSLRISLPIEVSTLNSTNISLKSCGTGDAASAATACVDVPGLGSPNVIVDANGITNVDLSFKNVHVQLNTWYRLSLNGSKIMSVPKLPERAAAQLDGDFDGNGGGDYVTTFKTGATPCVLAGAHVVPAKGLIESPAVKQSYTVEPLDSRCIILQCTGRTVSWTSESTAKATVAPATVVGSCNALVTPVSETDPGPPIHITGTVDTKSDQGELTIKYADPRVVEYGPRDCTEACVNTVAFAYFNTSMAEPGITDPANIKLLKCVNESCLAFDPTPIPVHPHYSDIFPPNQPDAGAKLLTFGNPNLTPNTFYRVIISGDVKSTGMAPLTALNYNGDSFSWTFRTRVDGNPCGPQKVTILPAQTTLHYITEVSPITALPLTSPDKCAVGGQILNSDSYNWSWTRTQNPAAPVAYRFLPDVPPGTLLNTNPVLPAGCSSNCLMTGSMPPGTSSCGNGIVEKGEACDSVPPGRNGCSANCLRTGNTDTVSCGNGTPEPNLGEECDEGKAKNGTPASGCTTSCLLMGSSTGISICGNGSTGVGEACDDGNTNGGDGCNAQCLLEGSQQNVNVCGNGKLEDPGEECDYRFKCQVSARECSTTADCDQNNPADVCNRTVATLLLSYNHASLALTSGQRDPSKPGFACTPSCLLTGNPVSCTSGLDCCGNGQIEPAKGEACDSGTDNGLPGSGCSTTCLRTGSNPELRAFCGDTVKTIKPSNIFTHAENGGGEECDATKLDLNIDGTQVVEARNRCDAGNSCTSSATAAVTSIDQKPIPPVAGTGGVIIEGSCTSDGDCAAFGAGLACGASGVCYPVPARPHIEPHTGNQCRNAQISISFEEEMDPASFTGNLIVESCGNVALKDEGGNWFARIGRAVGGFFKSLLGTGASAAGCTGVEGTFTSVKVVVGTTTTTVATFAPKQLFDIKREYQVTVKDGSHGVKTINGVGYPEGYLIPGAFSTGETVCSLDSVQMNPPSELLQTSAQVLTILASAMTNHDGQLQPIARIAGTYDWSWAWSTVPATTPPSILKLTPDTDPTGILPSAKVQANSGQNGQEQVVAVATITADTLFKPATTGQSKFGKTDITVMLCENPWPARNTNNGAWAPYVDPATHFEFYYCRDNGDTILPELEPAPTQGQSGPSGDLLRFCHAALEGTQQPRACFTNADCGSGDSCLSKDLFFQFKSDSKVTDAIGLRVFANNGRLAPQDWYVSQHFSGATQPATVDGYAAVKDAHTVYVAAVDKYGDPTLRPYVYVFAFNQQADPRTAEVFDRLVKNVRFNTNLTAPDRVVEVCKDLAGNLVTLPDSSAPISCTSDLDCFGAVLAPPVGTHCDSDKDKIRRDLKRWNDIADMQKALESTRESTGFYPKLESGTFVRGFSTSKWPSWSQQMGAAAKNDPLNAFNRCDDFGSECVLSGKACASDADCAGAGDSCSPKFDAATCFDERAGVFACPSASHVYQYRSIGGVDYRMSVDFEYTLNPWLDADCTQHHTQFSCDAGAGCSWLASGATSGTCQTRITIAPVCSGLFSDKTNKCLPGGQSCVDSAACGPTSHCVPSTVPLVGPAASASCGNGLKEGSEVCEIGQQKNASCGNGFDVESCNVTCSGWDVIQACPGAAACGNGSVETFANESCDDGAQNGQYGRCRSGSLGCAKRCVKITERACFVGTEVGGVCPGNADISTVITGTCTSNADCANLPYEAVCTDRMNFCGDGVKNGLERCDAGSENGKYGSCAWDCSGTGPRCGDSTINGGEQCDGDHAESSGVCVGAALADTSPTAGIAKACNTNADCTGGQTCAVCKPTTDGLPQTRSRGCLAANTPPDPTTHQILACTFDSWSACKQSGACGNGKVEGTEQCDAGTGNSASGACLPNCKKNVCGDGALLTGIEQCDDGAANGRKCDPKYGLTCNYCKTDCAIETISGAYCGDSRTGNPAKTTLDSPPESCDPGSVAAWCNRTYTDPSDFSHVVSCAKDADCVAGVCKNYAGEAAPAGTPACGDGFCNTNETAASCPDDCAKPCHGTSDCSAAQFCQGGEGQCTAYNVQCKPGPYTNTKAAPGAANYLDGSCNSCTSSCANTTNKSPASCGDDAVQKQFGESCEGAGDPSASVEKGTYYQCVACAGLGQCHDHVVQSQFGEVCDDPGNGTSATNQYECRADCKAWQGGWCGNNLIDSAHGESCDGTNVPSCDALGWGIPGVTGVGASACVRCKAYGGGCPNGDLGPGDVRITIKWDGDNDIDSHLILPPSQGGHTVGYNGIFKGSVISDPHGWISWDDQGNGQQPNGPSEEIISMNWRSNGAYWTSSILNPYKLYLYDYSGSYNNVRVNICRYDTSQPHNANCSILRTKNGGSGYWHVANIYGNTQTVPIIDTSVDKSGSCSCSQGSCEQGACSAIGL